MAKTLDASQISMNVQNEIMKKQQAIIRQYQKPLQQGQNMQKLQSFLESQKAVGSSAYMELSPMLQEVVLKLSLSSIEILAKSEKNPFKKFRFKIAVFATKKMANAGKAKKQILKDKERKKQEKIAKAQSKADKSKKVKTK